MNKIYVLILFGCFLFMWACATPDLNKGQNGGAPSNVFIYHFKKIEPRQPSDTKELIHKYLNKEAPNQLFISEENIAYYVSDKEVNNSFQQDLGTGNFTFNKMGKYMGDFKPDLPSPQKSEEMALQYLKKNKAYPEDASQLRLLHQGGLRSATITANNQQGKVIDKTITLYYGRVINKWPVIGPGSKIVVQVGDKGEIVGLIRRWREISQKDSVSQSQLITEAEAQREAKKQVAEEYGKVKYKITNVFKAYYDNNGSILQPVYGFEINIDPGQHLDTIQYLCVIPMLKNSPEALNLRQLDPRAREMIKKMKEGAKTPPAQDKIE